MLFKFTPYCVLILYIRAIEQHVLWLHSTVCFRGPFVEILEFSEDLEWQRTVGESTKMSGILKTKSMMAFCDKRLSLELDLENKMYLDLSFLYSWFFFFLSGV